MVSLYRWGAVRATSATISAIATAAVPRAWLPPPLLLGADQVRLKVLHSAAGEVIDSNKCFEQAQAQHDAAFSRFFAAELAGAANRPVGRRYRRRCGARRAGRVAC